MQTTVRVLLTLVVLSTATFLGYDMVQYYLYSPWTRDARVRADVVTVSPDVSGYVSDLRVRNDQFVRKGDILFVIDQARYRLALADAEADVAARLALKEMLLHQSERRSKLTVDLSITAENLENAQRLSAQAAASYQQSLAARDLAALNLERTEVRASVNGFVTNLNLVQGNYATQGRAVLALVDSDSYRVDAYFEETKVPQVKAGATVDIRLMDGSPSLQGKVESVARGITDQENRDGPELLATVNPTFTWVRLAQRVPVRIRLTYVPPHVLVSAGMTCTVVLEAAEPRIGEGFALAKSTIVEQLGSLSEHLTTKILANRFWPGGSAPAPDGSEMSGSGSQSQFDGPAMPAADAKPGTLVHGRPETTQGNRGSRQGHTKR